MSGQFHITLEDFWELQPELFYILLTVLFSLPGFYVSFRKRSRKELDEKFLQSPASQANGPYMICYSERYTKLAKAIALVYGSIVTLMRLYHFCGLILFIRTVIATSLFLIFIYVGFSVTVQWLACMTGPELFPLEFTSGGRKTVLSK